MISGRCAGTRSLVDDLPLGGRAFGLPATPDLLARPDVGELCGRPVTAPGKRVPRFPADPPASRPIVRKVIARGSGPRIVRTVKRGYP